MTNDLMTFSLNEVTALWQCNNTSFLCYLQH